MTPKGTVIPWGWKTAQHCTELGFIGVRYPTGTDGTSAETSEWRFKEVFHHLRYRLLIF